MGSVQGQTLNQGATTLAETSAYSGDPGDGSTSWFHKAQIPNGADVATGKSTTTTATTDPTAATATVLSLLRGILTFLRVSAAGLGKAEDSAHVSGDTGAMALAVRRDTAAASSGTTGDYEPLQTDSTGRLRTVVGGIPGYPEGATPVAVGSGIVSNATATATMAAVSGKTNYIAGFHVSGGGATAAAIPTLTITGLIGGTRSFVVPVPAGATAGIQPIRVAFYPPVPASAANTAIVVSVPAFGAGNTKAVVTATGYVV